jgi:hypothetical protein
VRRSESEKCVLLAVNVALNPDLLKGENHL